MTSTFLVQVDHGDDTDLPGVAEVILQTLSATSTFDVISVKPWLHPTLETPSPTPPGAPGTTQT